MNFAFARKIADAVLYEGYVLYPYRASAVKNRCRWQFGIVAPRAWSEQGGDSWEMQTACLIEPLGTPSLAVTIRFLQLEAGGGGTEPPWEQGLERTIDLAFVRVKELFVRQRHVPFLFPGETPISGCVQLSAARVAELIRLEVRIENLSDFPDAAWADRSAAMRRSMIGTHTLLGVTDGSFISLTDPPPAALQASRTCSNLHTWPVLAGPPGAHDVLLSSPIILEDYPAIAPESAGPLFDATEIDELLTLRVMTLTDEEKRTACATDERARQIIERCEALPLEVFEQLHGAMRSVGHEAAEDFFNPPDEQPESASVSIGGGLLTRGVRVRLTPKRAADAMDLFLAGRTAVVAGVHHDVENRAYVAVTLDDDPAADLQGRVGRFFYFDPDELELMGKEM
jgi:hypothetical protein